MVTDGELYEKAQLAVISLKSAVLTLLTRQGATGLRNTEIGRTLGIYFTPNGRQQGWMSMYLLHLLQAEGRVHQVKSGGEWVLSE